MKTLLPRFGWLERLRTERRQYFDEKVDRDLWDLLETSALLEVKEYTVFEMAYKDWHGKHAPSKVMEAHFSVYMFKGVIPVWVRRYCRKVIELNESGNLDPHQLGIYRPQPSRRLVLIGKLYALGLLLLFAVTAYFAFRHTYETEMPVQRASNHHPPHYNALP